MATKGSSALAMPSATGQCHGKRHDSHCDDKIPPVKPNLTIEINVGTTGASFKCRQREEVGPDKLITFLAKQDCELHFANLELLGVEYLQLTKDVPVTLKANVNAHWKETEYHVDDLKKPIVASESNVKSGDPIVVVP